jgi:hypothetical protein
MALASTSPDLPAPLDDLDTLYPLACMLVGAEAAPTLLVDTYERVADAPASERPESLDDWLGILLQEAPTESLEGDAPADPDRSASTSDPLGQEIAERLLKRTLPVALATCSAPERLALSLHAIGATASLPDDRLADMVEGSPPSTPLSLLREKLRAVLSPPEADLLDRTLSDEALQDAVRDLLRERFAPVPSSLRARLRSTLRTASPSEAPDEASPSSSAAESPTTPTDESDSALSGLPFRPRPRVLLVVVLLGALVLAGGLGVSYLTGSSSTSPAVSTAPSLVAFSAEQAGAVTTERATARRARAEAYLDSTWGRQIRLPSIEAAQLEGIGRLQAPGNTEVPVAVYSNAEDGRRIAVFLYNYALVDRLDGAAKLDTQVRTALGQRNQLVTAEQASPAGLLWRDGANIFVVVAPSLSVDSLRARVTP